MDNWTHCSPLHAPPLKRFKRTLINMPDPTNAARQRRYRERQAGRLPPPAKPICSACSITHTGARGSLCSRCWERLDPAGRQFKRERVAKARAGKRDG